MIPFRVKCETCQSWLQVRSESLVGQIHSCPKCGAMVHLVPGADPAADTTTKPAVATAAAAPTPASEFESVDELGLDTPAQPPMQEAEASPPAPADEPTPASPAEAFGYKLALGIGVGGTVLVVLGALTFYLMRGDEADTEIATAPAAPTPTPTEPPAEPAAETEPPTDDSRPIQPPVEEATPAAPTPEASLELPPLPPDPPAPLPAERDAEPTPKLVEEEPAKPTIDPLDYDPASLDLVLLRGKTQPTTKPAEPQTKGPEPLAIGLPGQELAEPAESGERLASLDQRLAARAKIERVWVERQDTAFEPRRPIDLARSLNESVPEFFLPETPLARGVRLWSDLAGVPVTIDPAALTQAGVSTQSKLSFQGKDLALAEHLLTSLKPLRLTYADRDGQLVVSRLGGEQEKSREYDVRDLLPPGATDASPIAELAAALVLDTEAAAQLTADETKLSLAAPASAHFDLAVFCERLRRARGLKQRTKYPEALLRNRPALSGLSPALDRSVTFSFVSPTPLTDVLEHWRRMSRVEVLADWASVADVKLGPRSLIRCSARDQSWREALEGVLHPLGLGWRAVDARTIQIASRGAAEQAIESLDFYPLVNAKRGEIACGQLREATSTLESPLSIHFDEPAGAMLVRASGAGHQFVYDWLLRQGLLDK